MLALSTDVNGDVHIDLPGAMVSYKASCDYCIPVSRGQARSKKHNHMHACEKEVQEGETGPNVYVKDRNKGPGAKL